MLRAHGCYHCEEKWIKMLNELELNRLELFKPVGMTSQTWPMTKRSLTWPEFTDELQKPQTE
jgi:hypothetical protein